MTQGMRDRGKPIESFAAAIVLQAVKDLDVRKMSKTLSSDEKEQQKQSAVSAFLESERGEGTLRTFMAWCGLDWDVAVDKLREKGLLPPRGVDVS